MDRIQQKQIVWSLVFIGLFSIFAAIAICVSYYKIKRHLEIKQFYFPEIELYMTLYKPFGDDNIYAIFSEDGSYGLTENNDYVRYPRTPVNAPAFYFKQGESTKIYCEDFWNHLEIHPSKFTIERIAQKDTSALFRDCYRIMMPNHNKRTVRVLRPEYCAINVGVFGTYVHFYDFNFDYDTFYDDYRDGIRPMYIEVKPL